MQLMFSTRTGLALPGVLCFSSQRLEKCSSTSALKSEGEEIGPRGNENRRKMTRRERAAGEVSVLKCLRLPYGWRGRGRVARGRAGVEPPDKEVSASLSSR